MSASSTSAINAMNAEDEYLDSLRALTTLALPLTKVPDKVPTTIGLQCGLIALEAALLRVQNEVMKQQLLNQRGSAAL